MKNITLSVDDETYRQARIKAAELSTTVSALVREYLQGLSNQPGQGDGRTGDLFAVLDKVGSYRAASRLFREEFHVGQL